MKEPVVVTLGTLCDLADELANDILDKPGKQIPGPDITEKAQRVIQISGQAGAQLIKFISFHLPPELTDGS